MRLLGAFCVAALAVAQPADREIPVVTVCDVLGDLARYNGKSIVLVGVAWGTDEGSWMVATCEKKLVTDGFTWPDSISSLYVGGNAAPPPALPVEFKWNSKLVAAKLKQPKHTTKLQHWEHWSALFGRLDANIPPRTFVYPNGERKGVGFGHLGEAPAQIISPQDRRAWRTLH